MKKFVVACVALLGVMLPAFAQIIGSGISGADKTAGAPPVGCTASNNLIARLDGTQSANNTAIHTLICGLVQDGIYASLDGLYVGATSSPTNARLNWAQNAYPLTQVGAVSYTSNRHYQGDGSSGVLTTTFNPSTANGQMHVNSGSFGGCVLNTRTTRQNYALLGAADATNSTFLKPYGDVVAGVSSGGSTGRMFFELNSSLLPHISSGGANGQWTITRTDANTVNVYKNGVLQEAPVDPGPSVTTAMAMPNAAISLLGINQSGTNGNFSNDQIAFAFFGGGLNQTQVTALYNRMNSYLIAVGIAAGCASSTRPTPPAPWDGNAWNNPGAAMPTGASHGTFHSAMMNTTVGFVIYTPPGYNANCSTRYPVFYNTPGQGGTENSLATDSGSPYYVRLQTLISNATLRPMIFVVINGKANSKYRDALYGTPQYGDYMHEWMVIKELIPYIDANYCTMGTAAQRGFTGFSMGGMGCERDVLKYPWMFGAMYCIAPANDDEAATFRAGGEGTFATQMLGCAADPCNMWTPTTPQALATSNKTAINASLIGQTINPVRIGIGNADGLYSNTAICTSWGAGGCQVSMATIMASNGIANTLTTTTPTSCGHDLYCDEGALNDVSGDSNGWSDLYWMSQQIAPVGTQALRAKQFTNSIGTGYPNGFNTTNINNNLTNLGITAVRSNVTQIGSTNNNAQINASATAIPGLRFNFGWFNYVTTGTGSCFNDASIVSQTFALIDAFVTAHPGQMLANEPLNETNNFAFCYNNNAITNGPTAAGTKVLNFAATLPELQAVAATTYTISGVPQNALTGVSVIDAGLTLDPTSTYTVFSTSCNLSFDLILNAPNEIAVMFIATNGGPVATVTSTSSEVTFTRRATTGGSAPIEEWVATGPAHTVSSYVTINPTSCAYIGASLLGIEGATGFDSNGVVTSGTDPISYTTHSANTIVLASFRMGSQSAPTAGAGWTQFDGGFFQLTEYQTLTSTQTLSATIGTGAGDGNGGIVDALVLSGPARMVSAIPAGTTITGVTNNTVTLNNNVTGSGVATGDIIMFQAWDSTHNTSIKPNADIVTAMSVAWTALIYNATHADSNMTGVKATNYSGFYSFGGAQPCCPPFNTNTFDYNNTHFYPGTQQPVISTGAASMKAAQQSGNLGGASGDGSKPWVMTEGGYCTPLNQTTGLVDQGGAVDYATQANLLLNLFLDFFSAGSPYATMYTLYDSNSGDDGANGCFDNYGLYKSDQVTIKTSGTAVKNLITFLNDTGGTNLTFVPGFLNFSFTPALPSRIFAMLMQKSNGRFYIAMWNESGQIWNNSTHTVINLTAQNETVNFGRSFTTVNVYDPLANTTNTSSGVSSVNVSLGNHPLIIECIP